MKNYLSDGCPVCDSRFYDGQDGITCVSRGYGEPDRYQCWECGSMLLVDRNIIENYQKGSGVINLK